MKRRSGLIIGSSGVLVAAALLLARTSGPAVSPEASAPAAAPSPHAAAAHSATAAPILRQAASSHAEAAEAPYLTDRVMVSLAVGADVFELASDFDVEVIREPGRSGVALLSVPSGSAPAELLSAMRGDDRLASASPVATIAGTGKGGREASGGSQGSSPPAPPEANADPCKIKFTKSPVRANSHQWHLDQINAPTPAQIDLSGITIAVLDTGVAYEDHTDASGSYLQAASLSSSAVVAPWDFVNDDEHANDDHQHGTHIASTIASVGAVEGVAPYATLMPLKVLDEHNSGHEADLIDAIYHAVDNGADIINMSLSFHPKYSPSQPMQDALAYAAEAGVVMVGAAGNDGLKTTTYPAAHPYVIAVGALMNDNNMLPRPAVYTNRSARVEISAPGGDLSADLNGDGIVDGIVAETISRRDPGELGLWMFAGSSQAAAIVTGNAAHLLAAGMTADQVPMVLQAGSWGYSGALYYSEGLGVGQTQVENSIWNACQGSTTALDPHGVRTAMMPHMIDNGDDTVSPRVLLQVMDAAGAPLADHQAYMTLWGSTSQDLTCTTDLDGTCEATGDPIKVRGALSWAVSVDTVVDMQQYYAYRPLSTAFSSDALEVLLSALHLAGEDDSMLALSWEAADDPELGLLAPGYTVVNLGTGLSSSPLGLMFNQQAVTQAAITQVDVDLDGTGLSSSPLGLASLRKLTFDGTGLSSSPLGFQSFSLITFDGTGLSSSPLGLTANMLLGGAPGSLDIAGMSLDGGRMDLSSGTLVGASGTGSMTDSILSSGGWVGGSSAYPAASLLLGSETVEVPVEEAPPAAGSDAGSQPL